MSAPVRLIREEDRRRAEVVDSYLSRFAGSEESARTIRSSLECVARLYPDLGRDAATFPWEKLADSLLFDNVQARVIKRYGSATAAKHMCAVRGVLLHCARLDLARRADVILTVENAAKIRKQSTPTLGLTRSELGGLLSAARAYPNAVRSVRDVALFTLVAATGCRRAEVCRVTWRDIDWERRWVTFPRTKGGSMRRVPLNAEAMKALNAWRRVHGAQTGPVFCAVRKNGTLAPKQGITAHQVWKLFRAYAREAGIPDDVTPHSLRVWFVTSLLEHGIDVLMVARAVGHRSPNTTARYDRRDVEAVRAVVERLEIPNDDAFP